MSLKNITALVLVQSAEDLAETDGRACSFLTLERQLLINLIKNISIH